MKIFIIIAFMLFNASSTWAQKSNYSPDEIKRLADLGRVWGMVNYFHPAMGNGNINTASLIVPSAEALAKNPSAENFKVVVGKMLGQLKDPFTTIATSAEKSPSILNTISDRPAVHKLTSGYWYIALPTSAVSEGDFTSIPGIMPSEWDNAKGIILDLRNKTSNAFIDYDFLYDALPVLERKLIGNGSLPDVFERVVYHNGLVPQENGENNIYFSGWRTITKSTSKQKLENNASIEPWGKPVAFVINGNTSYELVKRLLALRTANKCLIVYEGKSTAYATGSIKEVPIADGLILNLRVSDVIFGSNVATPTPDLVIPTITEFGEKETFIQQCIQLLDKGIQPAKNSTQSLSLQYSIPRFSDTNSGFYVSTGERLLGLYNFWNAIHYFNPYKKLLPKDWNIVLEEHIPAFIEAKDSVAYNFALRRLISDIHDCHGFFSSPKGTTPVRHEFGYWPAIDVEFIGDKLYVTSLGKDSLPGKNIKQWDEVTSIDGKSIEQCLKDWRWYTATSNEATYKRDVAGILLGGKINSTAELKINRGGELLKESLTRTGRYFPANNASDFNSIYPVFKMLNNSTGYVNMGALNTSQVDSMFILFKNTTAIVMDIRNYPKGTAWSIAPRLTATKKPAVKFHYPLITAESINGGEDDMTGESFFYVNPDTTKPVYKGKIIILCNASTQSQAEYSVMMFQGATNVTVIGSQTAGADGNVTTVILPGNYRASFSGLEVLYPDGGQTQRSGIRVDIQSSPTLKGLQAGRDEVLERAMQFLKTGK